MQAPKQASPEAFNPAIFAQAQPSQSFEAVSNQAMQATPNLYAAPSTEVPVDLRAQIILDSSKYENPVMTRWMAERQAARDERMVALGAMLYISFLSDHNEHARRSNEKKEKVNA